MARDISPDGSMVLQYLARRLTTSRRRYDYGTTCSRVRRSNVVRLLTGVFTKASRSTCSLHHKLSSGIRDYSMLIGFVDESGTPAPSSKEEFFIVALLLVKAPRRVEKLVRRIRRSLRRRARTSELKATRSHPRIIRRLLTGLTAIECEIYITVVDKRGMTLQQGEAVYRAAIASVVRHCIERHPKTSLYLDKRYTNYKQQTQLEQTIREAIAHVPRQVVLIEQADSWAMPGLQAVDFVAWAFGQKHGRGDDWATQIIAQKVVLEERVRGTKIAVPPGGR